MRDVIAKAFEFNPATGAPKRSCGKSPSSKDKPKKVRRKIASAKKSKASSPKPPTTVQSSFGVAPAAKSSVPTVASTSSSSQLKQYRLKTSAGRIKALESSEEVSS